ncbi:hypothetical protein D3C72_1365080 [compost metagenome]
MVFSATLIEAVAPPPLEVIVGASLLPVTVMVTSWVSTPPRPSLTCTVNTSL